MKRDSQALILKIIVSLYGLIYLNGFLIPMIGKDMATLKSTMPVVEVYTVPMACVLFIVGVAISWWNEKIGGIIILVWHFVVWFFSMYLWREAGMVLILIFPMLIPPVFLILHWYKKRTNKYANLNKQWKLVLNILMLNYAAIYILIVIAEVIPKLFGLTLRDDPTVLNDWNYNISELSILIAALAMFVIACIAVFKSRLITGILLVLWYALIFHLSSTSYQFSNSGPWTFFSLPLIVQGVLYIVLHFYEKHNKQKEEHAFP